MGCRQPQAGSRSGVGHPASAFPRTSTRRSSASSTSSPTRSATARRDSGSGSPSWSAPPAPRPPRRGEVACGPRLMFSIVVPCGDAAGQERGPRARRRPRRVHGAGGENEAEIRAAMTILLEGWRCKSSPPPRARGPMPVAARGRRARHDPRRLSPAGAENGIQIMRRLRRRYPGVGGVLITGDIGPETLRGPRTPATRSCTSRCAPRACALGALWRARLARRQWESSQEAEAAAS